MKLILLGTVVLLATTALMYYCGTLRADHVLERPFLEQQNPTRGPRELVEAVPSIFSSGV